MKKLLIILVALFVVIQFIPANLPEVTVNNPDDLLKTTTVPDNIAQKLRASCYDCHSNETVYPWYSYLAPVSFLVSRDTREGRKKLNFSDWNKLSKVKKAKFLDEINDELEEGEMPMKIYTLIHRNAVLNDQDIKALQSWVDDYAESLFE
jgi:hypothetical protein